MTRNGADTLFALYLFIQLCLFGGSMIESDKNDLCTWEPHTRIGWIGFVTSWPSRRFGCWLGEDLRRK